MFLDTSLSSDLEDRLLCIHSTVMRGEGRGGVGQEEKGRREEDSLPDVWELGLEVHTSLSSIIHWPEIVSCLQIDTKGLRKANFL